MKRTILAGLGALALACGGGTDNSISYGSPQPSTAQEQAAAGGAQTTLAATAAYQASPEPTVGAPGLADQLAADLGAYAGMTAPTDPLRTLAAPTLGRSPGTALFVPMDPACVVQDATSVTWTDCTTSNTDDITGDTMTLVVNGSLTWNPVTGVTSWDVVQSLDASMTMDAGVLTIHATAHPVGSITVTGTTIVGHAASTVSETASYLGQTVSATVVTTLDLDLGYQAEPFCITSGTLELEQVWTRRPAGYSEAELPNQGWRFEWSGCGLFTVAHGS
ncbi:MAG TPA: hypothetical protein VLS93_08705 [Anaeromyxobacteraceae bacterium]|nr:hypothetical protein [Anaeromyxobacteraceae bacterium]